MVPPRSPPHSPRLPSSGCGNNTGRSPASKHPNGSSGTCTAGDRPVSRTRPFRGANGTHRDTRSSCRVSMAKIVVPTFGARFASDDGPRINSSPHCPSRSNTCKQSCSRWLVWGGLDGNAVKEPDPNSSPMANSEDWLLILSSPQDDPDPYCSSREYWWGCRGLAVHHPPRAFGGPPLSKITEQHHRTELDNKILWDKRVPRPLSRFI